MILDAKDLQGFQSSKLIHKENIPLNYKSSCRESGGQSHVERFQARWNELYGCENGITFEFMTFKLLLMSGYLGNRQ